MIINMNRIQFGWQEEIETHPGNLSPHQMSQVVVSYINTDEECPMYMPMSMGAALSGTALLLRIGRENTTALNTAETNRHSLVNAFGRR